jgi:hypothetical protein
MSCQCGNGCNNYTTPTSFSNVDISGSSIVGSTFSGGVISASQIAGYSVDTIADLKALTVASLSLEVVDVLGYSAAGDGGGGLFRYDSASVVAPNLGTVFVPNIGGGRWLRVYSGPLNVRWFGAKGDGATDDYAAIQAALSTVPTNGGQVYAPAGEYLIKTKLTIATRSTLFGEGGSETSSVDSATIIAKAATLATTAIELTSASSNLFDLSVVCAPGNGGNGIDILANGCCLRNVTVSGAGQDGIRIGDDAGVNANSWSLINVNSSGNTRHGVYLNDLNFNANAGHASRLACLGNTGDGVRCRHADKNTFSGCLMEGNTGYGWHFLASASHQSLNTVVGGDSEGNTAGDILVTNTSWYNTFINPGALGTVTYNLFTTVISEQFNRIASNVTNGELLSNAPQGGAGSAGTSEYYSIYDSSAVERIRIGFQADQVATPNLVPAQVMADTWGDVLLASRDINDGSVRFDVGLGPVTKAGVYGPDGTLWVGPGPTNSNAGHVFFQVPNGGWNGADTGAYVGKDAGTNRSVNAAGTLNASGTDYAEYMFKANPSDVIEKGEVCGIDANEKLTKVFSEAVSFVVKSTNPSYVGGDVWGGEDVLGKPPVRPDARKVTAREMAEYETAKADYEARLEVERVKVDRIAFAGIVPVNATGASVGDYAIPVDSSGAVGVTFVVSPTLAQYRLSVGKVVSIGVDGRPRVLVKVS